MLIKLKNNRHDVFISNVFRSYIKKKTSRIPNVRLKNNVIR